VGCSTEIFESFNAIFRQCSVLSNRQAPSHDIAIQFGKQEGFKHRVTGGWWKAKNGDWVQVGPGIKKFVANNLEILENVGLSSDTLDKPGMLYVYSYILNPTLITYSRSNQVGSLRAQARSAPTTPPSVMGSNKSLAGDELCLVPLHAESVIVPCPVPNREVI